MSLAPFGATIASLVYRWRAPYREYRLADLAHRASAARAVAAHVRYTVPSAALDSRLAAAGKDRARERCRRGCGCPALWFLAHDAESTSLGFGHAWPATQGEVSRLLAAIQAKETRFQPIAKR